MPPDVDLLKIDADAGKHWQDVGFDKKREEIRQRNYAKRRAAWLAERAVIKDAFDPEQDRDEGGKWTAGGGGGKSAPARPAADHPGHGYSVHAHLDAKGVIHTSNVYDATRALSENRKVELRQPREAATLIEHLGQVSKHMIAMGKDAPHFNLCNVSVPGSNLFCAESKGIPRVQMPQLDDQQTKDFRHYLEAKGYAIEKDDVKASHLRATQNELDGAKVAKIAAHLAKHPKDKDEKRLIVSRDNYILDGHHHWAGLIGVDADDNKLGGLKMKVSRVDIGIIALLKEAQKFTGGKGAKGIGDQTSLDAFDPGEERDPAGKWTSGGGGNVGRAAELSARLEAMATRRDLDAATTAEIKAEVNRFMGEEHHAAAIRHGITEFAKTRGVGVLKHALEFHVIGPAVTAAIGTSLSMVGMPEPVTIAASAVALYAIHELSKHIHVDRDTVRNLLSTVGHAIGEAHGEYTAAAETNLAFGIGDAAASDAVILANLARLLETWDSSEPLTDAFDPGQPRDPHGRWGSGGAGAPDWHVVLGQRLEAQAIRNAQRSAKVLMADKKTKAAVQMTVAGFVKKHVVGVAVGLPFKAVSLATTVAVEVGLAMFGVANPITILIGTGIVGYAISQVRIKTGLMDGSRIVDLLSAAGHAILAAHAVGQPDDEPPAAAAALSYSEERAIGDQARDARPRRYAAQLGWLQQFVDALDELTPEQVDALGDPTTPEDVEDLGGDPGEEG